MASYKTFSPSAAETRRQIGERLCRNRGPYGSCGQCEYNLYSQTLLRAITFREVVGIMSSIIVPTIDAPGTPNYIHCLVLCNGNTVTRHKVIDLNTKVVCDTTLCRFMATEWLGYNGTRGINTNTVRTFMDIITSTTTTVGLVDALYVLYANYSIWDMNGGTAAYAASCTQDGNHYRNPGVSSHYRY
jgi:hypothetical protein